MAIDTRISGLPVNPGVTPTDVVEVLDTSNTTNQATGENTQATVAGLVTGLPVMIASGTGHAAGLVPDPGAVAGTTKFLREDATFAVPSGGGGGLTSPVGIADGGTGQVTAPLAINALLPGQSGASGMYLGSNGAAASWSAVPGGGGLSSIADQRIIANISGSSAIPIANSHSDILDSIYGATQGQVLYRGASVWSSLAPGTAGQVLQSGGAAGDPAWGDPTLRKIFSCGTCDAVANTTAATSLLGNPTTATGSLTLPANTLILGSVIRFQFIGQIGATGTPTLLWTISLGGLTIATGISAAFAAATPGRMWDLFRAFFRVSAAGAGGSIRGSASWVARNTATTSVGSADLSTTGSGDASAPVAINTTIPLAFDIKITWSVANSLNTIQTTAGEILVN